MPSLQIVPQTTQRLQHEPGTDTPDHRCEPRILAPCAACGDFTVWCSASQETVSSIVDETFVCARCQRGSMLPAALCAASFVVIALLLGAACVFWLLALHRAGGGW